MPLDSGLAALFSGLSTFGRELPGTVLSIEQHDERERKRKIEEDERARQEAARKTFATATSSIPLLGSTPGVGSQPLDLTQFQDPQVDPMIGLLGGLNPTFQAGRDTFLDGAIDPIMGITEAAPPKKVTYRDQINHIRSQVKTPEDLAILNPYMTNLDAAADAEERGDVAKAKAYADEADRHLQEKLTNIREAGADRRNREDNQTSRANSDATRAAAAAKTGTAATRAKLDTYRQSLADKRKNAPKPTKSETVAASAKGKRPPALEKYEKDVDALEKNLIAAAAEYNIAAQAEGASLIHPAYWSADATQRLAAEAIVDPVATPEEKARARQILGL